MNNAQRFREAHGLSPNLNLEEHTQAIDALLEIHDLTQSWLGEIDNKTHGEMVVVLSYMNLSSRIFDHADGMLVCLVTKAWSSAEALARVVLEGCVGLLCLALNGGGVVLKDFFESWLAEHEKRLDKWQEMEQDRHNALIVRGIEVRRSMVYLFRTFLDQQSAHLAAVQPHDPNAPLDWPRNIREKFKRAGMEEEYLSTYHRMSSSVHLLAEDTLSWLVMVLTPVSEDGVRAIQDEADAYSTLLVRTAMLAYVNSLIACCVVKGMKDMSVGSKHREALVQSLHEIGLRAGVPGTDTSSAEECL